MGWPGFHPSSIYFGGVLARQCLDERMEDKATLTRATTAWAARRNRKHCRVDWQFTNADARVKLQRLYPSVQM